MDDTPHCHHKSSSRMAPPWVAFTEHPLSICWRMGAGEDYIRRFEIWWDSFKRDKGLEERVAYFLSYPIIDAWGLHIVEWLFDMSIWEADEQSDLMTLPQEFKAAFGRAAAFGFPGYDAYLKDYCDTEKWLGPDSM